LAYQYPEQLGNVVKAFLEELMVDMVRTLRQLEKEKMVDPIYWAAAAGGSCG
jgi:hypothetical protein